MSLAHKRASAVLAVLALLSISCGDRATRHVAMSPARAVRPATFAEAADAYLSGDFRTAASLFQRLAWGLKGGADAAEVRYWLGRSQLALARIEPARHSFARAWKILEDEPGFRREDLRAHVLSAQADTALRQGRPADALGFLRRLEAHGLAPQTDSGYLAYRRASSLERLGRTAQACVAYRDAARRSADPALALVARRKASRLSRTVYRATAGVFATRSSAEQVAWALREHGVDARVEEADQTDSFAVGLGTFDRRD
jgi:tetratricopeptide (TPR) repeat protein